MAEAPEAANSEVGGGTTTQNHSTISTQSSENIGKTLPSQAGTVHTVHTVHTIYTVYTVYTVVHTVVHTV